MDGFLNELDPGLVTYKDEFSKLSVSSFGTLKYLRQHEVCSMNIPAVFKRMLNDKIADLQSPNTKKEMKKRIMHDESECLSTEPKKVKRILVNTNSTSRGIDNFNICDNENVCEKEGVGQPVANTLEKEMENLKDERESLSILLTHKKNQLKDIRIVPEPLCPVAIPGGMLTKTVCDHCHHKGHKYKGNRGGVKCPFDACEGYLYCGILQKHKEYKSLIQETEKEASDLDKDVKKNQDKIDSLQTFLQTNTTNFVKSFKPKLQLTFLMKYRGKDGNQELQKDIRYIKIATKGKIPENVRSLSSNDLSDLIEQGHKIVYSKYNSKHVADINQNQSVLAKPHTPDQQHENQMYPYPHYWPYPYTYTSPIPYQGNFGMQTPTRTPTCTVSVHQPSDQLPIEECLKLPPPPPPPQM